MLAIIRADSSHQIGTGHVIRCLTLSLALNQQGFEVLFICREHPGNLIPYIEQQGIAVGVLPHRINTLIDKRLRHSDWLGSSIRNDAIESKNIISEWVKQQGYEIADLLVVDHYALDAEWETTLRTLCRKILVIDDLADRKHDCDWLLDQSFNRDANDYNKKVPIEATLLIGPKYCLLRPEFSEFRQASLKRREENEINNILISMGGVDKDNLTGSIIDQLMYVEGNEAFNITAILGSSSLWVKEVKKQAACSTLNICVKQNISNMAEVLSQSDLVLGAAGTSTWERCALGVPSVVFVLASNQTFNVNQLSKKQIVFPANNEGKNFNLSKIFSALTKEKLKQLSKNSSMIVDGFGVQRVLENLNKILI